MAVGYNPRAITDGLVLALDAGNPKNYNAGISTNWTDKVGGNNGTLVNGTYHNDGPFVGAGYVEFDGTDDELNFTSIDVGTGDFTYEAWVYPTASVNQPIIVWHNSTSKVHTFGLWASGQGVDAIFSANARPGSSNSSEVTSAISLNTWHHIAFVRASGTLKVYVDGTEKSLSAGPGSIGGDPSSYSTDVSYVGSSAVNENFVGKISNARVISGTALYTSNFTPPTKSLTAITNTVLLTCQGNSISDASSSGHTITVNGDAAASLGYPASAFEFDGSNDYVDIGASSDFNFGTGDFTVEGWVNSSTYSTDNGAYRRFFVLDGPSTYNATGQLAFMVENTNGKIYVFGDGIGYTSSGILANGSWNHFAVTRIGNTIYLYVNGAAVGSTSHTGSFSPNSGSPRPRIGAYTSSAGRWNGKISAVKIYKGKGLTAAEVEQNYNATKGRYA